MEKKPSDHPLRNGKPVNQPNLEMFFKKVMFYIRWFRDNGYDKLQENRKGEARYVQVTGRAL